MDAEHLRMALLGFPDTTEETPFDEHTIVYKVSGKMFALTDYREKPLSVNLKCDPDLALGLRDEFPCVVPGYHMSKKHWNTVILDGSVPDSQIDSWIRHSFEQVLNGLPKSRRQEIEAQLEQGVVSRQPQSDPELRELLKKTI